MGNSKDTLFESNAGGTGGAAGDYLVDNFQDMSTPANSNSGLNSTALTNPLTQSFLNDDNPKYAVKTLWIKDLVLLEQARWISAKPTYQILWSEAFPGVGGYCVGDIRIRNIVNGRAVDVRQIDDIFGVSGVIRRCQFILNSVTDATATADLVIDGVDTGSDADWSSAATLSAQAGVNKYYSVSASASSQTKDIHDYRLVANQQGTLSVAGVVVWYENATLDIDLFPGSTYVNKVKQTTSSITSASIAGATSPLGANSLIYKTANAQYAQAQTQLPYLQTLSTGSGAATTVTVTTGQGSSFPIGSGIVAVQGTSMYVGAVTNISTDTLTVNPALPFALSGASTYKAWFAGPTIAISSTLFASAYSFDPGQAFNDQQHFSNFGEFIDGQWVPANTGTSFIRSGSLRYSDPEHRYYVWGGNLSAGAANGEAGVKLRSIVGTGFLQAEGYANAMELEITGDGAIFHATFSVNGCIAWGINETITGVVKKTVFTDAGTGWNSFYASAGSSHGEAFISKINFYRVAENVGQTLGRLSSYDIMQSTVERTAHNASLIALGTFKRYFADDLYFKGTWGRGLTSTVAGGVFYAGSANTQTLNFNFYGNNFAVIGTAGATVTVTLNGSSINSSFGVLKSAATLGFHTVVVTPQNNTTTIISAIDVTRRYGELKNMQEFVSTPMLENLPSVYAQTTTPRFANPGSLWVANQENGEVFIKAWNKWLRLKSDYLADDPNAVTSKFQSYGDVVSIGNANVPMASNVIVLYYETATPGLYSSGREFNSTTDYQVPLGKKYIALGFRLKRSAGTVPFWSFGYGDTGVGLNSSSPPTNLVTEGIHAGAIDGSDSVNSAIYVEIPAGKFPTGSVGADGINAIGIGILVDDNQP